jgi:predicted transcriptional regulator
MITTILSILVAAAYIAANIAMVYIAMNVNGNDTVADILNEQDFGLGKAGVILVYWPALLFISIRSLRPINTSFSFGEDEEVK